MRIDYKNDFAFRYIMGKEDETSLYLLKVFIEGALNLHVQSLTVKNSELIPEQMNDKDMILDILVLTQEGEYIDIEMQNCCFSILLRKRFQLYGSRMLSQQLKKGESYTKLKHIYQIIFIDDIHYPVLVDTYENRNKEGQLEEDNLITRAYVQIPFINHIIKHRDLSELTEFEISVYIIENGVDDGIMGIGKEVIHMMKKEIDEFNQDEQLKDIAYKRMLSKMVQEGEKEEKYHQGFTQGVRQTLIQYIHSCFQKDLTKEIEALSSSQLETIQTKIFQCHNIEEIKVLLKS